MQSQKALLFVCLLFLASFLLVAQFKNSFMIIDLQANSWATSIQTDSFTVLAVIISNVFDITPLIAISLTVAVYLFYRNYRRYSALLLAAMGGDTLIVFTAKELIHSPRPLNSLVYDTGFSFPSGHAAGSIILCGSLTFMAWRMWRSPKAKPASSTLLMAITLIVAFDRIYLNVHWFSDVLGGCLLGAFWLAFSLLVFRYVDKTRISFGDSEQNPLKCSVQRANQYAS